MVTIYWVWCRRPERVALLQLEVVVAVLLASGVLRALVLPAVVPAGTQMTIHNPKQREVRQAMQEVVAAGEVDLPCGLGICPASVARLDMIPRRSRCPRIVSDAGTGRAV